MGINCIAGYGSYIYWGRNGTLNSGTPASDTHQAFNPMTSCKVGKGKYAQEQVTTFDKLIHNLEYSSKFEEFEVSFKCYFRDPFILLAAMGYVSMPTSWTGTSDTITANFSSLANYDEDLWVRVHAHDQSGSGNHIDVLLDGGEITAYKWILEANKPLMEEFTIKFTRMVTDATAVDIDDGFDDGSFDDTGIDGGWSLWDGTYTSDTAAMVKDATVTWNAVAFAGMDLRSVEFEFITGKERWFKLSSQIAAGSYFGKIEPVNITVAGIMTAHTNVSQMYTAYTSKNKYTFKILYDTNKYLQSTNVYIEEFDGEIPESGKPMEGSFSMKGGADFVLSYQWQGAETTDPGNHANHTNV